MDDICAFCGGDKSVPRQVLFHGADRSILICRACVRAAASLLDDLDGIAKIRPPAAAPTPIDDTEARGRLLELRP